MKPSDKNEFDEVLVALAELHDKKLSDPLLTLYWEALKDISFEDFKKAANVLARAGKFFPKPVDFREYLSVDMTTQAALAYKKVDDAFYKAGIYATVIFDDPIIHAVIDNLGGWVKFCNQSDDELKWWRKDFEKAYQGMGPLVARGELTPPRTLPGLYAIDSQSADTAKDPIYIGNKEVALEWTCKALGAGSGFEKVKEEMPKLQELCEGIGGSRT